MHKMILASKSPFRSQLLENAGVQFTATASGIDERSVEKPLLESGASAEDIAEVLAIAKATDVSQSNPGVYVIGSDQTLSLGDDLLHKPQDMEAARRRLLQLSGRTHDLNSAVVLVLDGEVIWRHVSVSRITFRKLSPGFIGRHLSSAGEAVLSSVGAYQIEGLGVQLFEKIEGDYFSIMGLPLLPLLTELRKLGVLES